MKGESDVDTMGSDVERCGAMWHKPCLFDDVIQREHRHVTPETVNMGREPHQHTNQMRSQIHIPMVVLCSVLLAFACVSHMNEC
jgi:hypothetical protein